MSLGIVVPAYRPPVDTLSAYLRALDDRLDPEVVRIELDAADASTADELRELADDEGIPVAVNAVDARRGKGAAVTAGFEALRRLNAGGARDLDAFVFVDADGATPADSVADVVDPVLADEADLAVGSRRHPESEIAGHQGHLRRYLGDGFAWLARRVVGSVGGSAGAPSSARLHDYQCGAKALSPAAWDAVRSHLHQSGFAWDLELVAVAAALGCRLREVPVSWEDQPGSTVSPVRDTLGMFAGLLAARHRAGVAADSRIHRRLDATRVTRAALGGSETPLIGRPSVAVPPTDEPHEANAGLGGDETP